LSADTEFEWMAVLPADRDLQHEVQVIEPDHDRYFDATKHRWRHLVDRDLETRDVGHASGHGERLVTPGTQPSLPGACPRCRASTPPIRNTHPRRGRPGIFSLGLRVGRTRPAVPGHDER